MVRIMRNADQQLPGGTLRRGSPSASQPAAAQVVALLLLLLLDTVGRTGRACAVGALYITDLLALSLHSDVRALGVYWLSRQTGTDGPSAQRPCCSCSQGLELGMGPPVSLTRF